MQETFYRKVGRRYQPVAEYDSDLMDAFTSGSHLVVCEPGCKSTHYNVNPDHASLLAAFKAHRDELGKALMEASAVRMSRRESTPLEQRAWKAWVSIMGDKVMVLESPAAYEILNALEASLVKFAAKEKADGRND